MKKLASLLALAGVTMLSSSLVNAQSAFEGAYGQIGVGYESVTPSFSGGSVYGRGYSASGSNADSFVGTATIGYSFAVTPSFLLGIGAEYSPFAGSTANYTLTVPGVGSATSQYNKENSYNVFISPGLVIDKDKLAYAKIGYTGATVKSDGDSNTNLNGYSLGLGYKQIISGGLYGFGEVNYASYGNTNVSAPFSGTFSANSMNALLGIGYKF